MNKDEHKVINKAFAKDKEKANNIQTLGNMDEKEPLRMKPKIFEIHAMKEAIIGKRAPRNKKQIVEEDKIMTEQLRKKESSGATKLAAVVKFFFSNAGLMYGCVAYAVWGANMYRAMELPEEELRYEEKRRVAIQIEDNMEYLADVSIFLFFASIEIMCAPVPVAPSQG